MRYDSDAHAKLRLRLAREFTIKRIARMEPFIRQLVTEHIDRLGQKQGPADLYREFGLPIPAMVISELLGVPEGDRETFEKATTAQVDLSLSLHERQAAAAESAGFFAGLVASKYENPGDDLISKLIQEPAGRPMDFAELTGLSLLLLAAGHDTTANMITLATYALLQNPDQAGKMTANPAILETGVDELISVFQWGWADAILAAPTGSPILSLLPISIVGILFGLAMDYQVFLVCRMKDAYARGYSPREAVLKGFSKTAFVVVAAAAIMAAVFGGFALRPLPLVASIALALTSGVLP